MNQNITKEMTDELNARLKEEGCNFYFEFKPYLNSSIGEIHLRFLNTKFLNISVWSINSDGRKFIRKFFVEKGIDCLQETRTGGLIAYQHDGKVY